MAEGKRAEFNFIDFKAIKFGLDYTNDNGQGLSIRLSPKGEYSMSKCVFSLRFDFLAFQESMGDANPIINATIEANFKFNEGIGFQDIPDYFYRNAIAIAYPYLRAFVSTLTLQANSGLLVLPVMNLTNLEGEFRENSKAVA